MYGFQGIRGQKVLVLNVDTVLRILMEYEERGDWTEAIVACIPPRKLVYPQEREIIKKEKMERKLSAPGKTSAAQAEGLPSTGATENELEGGGDEATSEVPAEMDGHADDRDQENGDMNDIRGMVAHSVGEDVPEEATS